MRSRPIQILIFAAIVAALAAPAPAAETVVPSGTTVTETGPGWGVVSTTTMASAQVIAVDPASRHIDLRFADGRVVGLVAGSEVRRLAEIRPGDIVNVAFVEALALELKKQGAPIVARSEGTDIRRGPSNAPPGGVIQADTTVLADVLAVDATRGVVTLRGPQGTVNLRVQDPAQIALIQAGDQVQATYSEAVAVSVDPVR